jgi:hypothetical protein
VYIVYLPHLAPRLNPTKDKIMANLEGKTPQTIAAEIVKEATTDIVVKIDGVRGQDLDSLLKYKHAKQIYSKGMKWFNDNLDFLRKDFIENVIESQFDQRKKQDAAQSEKEKHEYYKLLISRGVEKIKALEMAGM